MTQYIKHTPAPWVEDTFYDEFTGWINGADGNPVIEYQGCGSHQANWPNHFDKALVLAAPELLEALEAAFGDGFYETATESYDCVPKGFIDLARAAIAKARGQS